MKTSTTFCVNHGECQEFKAGDPSTKGCKCPEGYYGKHCEKTYSNSNDNNNNNNNNAFGETERKQSRQALFLVVCGVLLGGFATAVVLLTYNHKGRGIDEHFDDDNDHDPFSSSFGGDGHDEDEDFMMMSQVDDDVHHIEMT
mmetsp:Transcript_33168/g.50740  ORF Transcript_33168/g.50740 Transcript_33168/m.50740 type:complete len:142 (+) Transcript_33168:237-662(+)